MRMICFGLCLLGPIALLRAAETSGPSAEAVEFFESRIRPVLATQCASCHNSADAAEGGFAVDSRAALRAGGDSGAVIVPGEPEKSRLLAILRHEVTGLEMPQDGRKLNDRVLQDFETWIAMGAPDPRTGSAPAEDLADATSWETIRRRRQQ